MRKIQINTRLEQDKLDYLDYMARRLNPEKPNRTSVIELVLDLVMSNFTDDMVLSHAKVMQVLDQKIKRSSQ